MRTLLLDTSTKRGVIGLADDGKLLHQQFLPSDRRHARDLIPAMKSACESVGWKLRSLKLLAPGIGPGSYTGLRVSVAAVKALALTNDAAIIALDSLEVVANRAETAARICAVADAQQQRIYTSWFRSEQTGVAERTSPTALQATDEWLASLQLGDVVTGPAVERWVDRIPSTCRIVGVEDRFPQAEAMFALCRREFAAERFADLHELEPIYLRPSAAEERRPA